MQNKLPGAIAVADNNAKRCVERAEFFKAKSRANYAEEAASNWQRGAEDWANIEELLRELAQYRNFAQLHPALVADVADGMRCQGYEY